MPFTAKMYGQATLKAWNKEVDWDSDTITVGASTSVYTPDQDAHIYANAITNEVSGGGYSRKTLASKTATYTGATNKCTFDAADVTWTAASFTVRTFWIADTQTGADATSPLLGYQQNDADISGGGADLILQWNAAGIFEYTIS